MSDQTQAIAPLAVDAIVGRVRRIQEVMKAIMKDGTHYGIIPGTPKPTLYQPGAELLCATFRIAPTPAVEDLSRGDSVRYRVTMRGINQATGELMGEGVGECSSDETKYRWVRPTCDAEWQETPEDQRREKWMRGKNGEYKVKQIRSNPADIANTILKMAYKRGLISMTRTVLACSDIFAQDLEDLPEEVREVVVEGEPKPPIREPQAKDAAPEPAGVRVIAVEEQSGTSPDREKDGKIIKGRPWTRWLITLSDGRKASTFDTQIRDAARTVMESRAPIDVVIEGENGRSKITEITLAGVER